MYCKNCGKEIDEDSVFCEFCGSTQKNSDILLFMSTIVKENDILFSKIKDMSDSSHYSKIESLILCASFLYGFEIKDSLFVKKNLLKFIAERVTISLYGFSHEDYFAGLRSFYTSVESNTGGMGPYEMGSFQLNYFFDNCKTVHIVEKKDKTNKTRKYIDFSMKDLYQNNPPIIISEELSEYTLEDFFNERDSLYVNYYKAIGTYCNQGYLETTNAVEESDKSFVIDYISRKILYFHEIYSNYRISHNHNCLLQMYCSLLKIGAMMTDHFFYDTYDSLQDLGYTRERILNENPYKQQTMLIEAVNQSYDALDKAILNIKKTLK